MAHGSDPHVLEEHLIDSWQDVLRNLFVAAIIAVIVWFAATALEVLVIAWIKTFHVIPFTTVVSETAHHAHDKADKVVRYLDIRHNLSFLNFTGFPFRELTLLFCFMMLGALLRSILLSFHTWQDAIGNGVTETWDYFHNPKVEKESEKDIAAYPATTFSRTIRRMIMTVATLCSGGSGGLEGPIVPVGESIGSGISKLFKIKTSHNLQLFQLVGVASGLSCLLSAPFTSAIFASEMFLPQKMVYRFVIYSLFAAVIVNTLNVYTFGSLHPFIIEHHSKYYSIKEFALITLICVFFSAPAGLALAKTQHISKAFFSKFRPFARAPLGAVMLFTLISIGWFALKIEPFHIIGMGEISLMQILNDETSPMLHMWWIVLLIVFIKMIATSITLQSGGSVGLLIPAMYMGGMTGYGMYELLDSYGLMHASAGPDLYVISGIVSALVTIVDIPLASIAFVIEVFGANYGPPAIISVVICYKIASRIKR